jgi:ligand-binding SRPBCC domain-containing protein
VIHYLIREQIIPAAIEQVWDYFSDPRNLDEMTPPDMRFQILTAPLPRMYAGQVVEYRVELIRGLPSLWLTEIAHVREPRYFVDEQRLGPYRFWYHEHKFEPVTGGTRMSDQVTYSIGFGPLGDLLNAVWIGRRLRQIFDFRAEKIRQLFPERRNL